MASTLPMEQSPAICSVPLDSPEVLGNMFFSGVVTCSVRSYFSFSPFPVLLLESKTPIIRDVPHPLHQCCGAGLSVLSPGAVHAETQSLFSNSSLLFPPCQTARSRRDFMWPSQPHPRKLLSSHYERGRHTSKTSQGRQNAECLYPRCPKC